MAVPGNRPGRAASGAQRAPWSTLDPAAKRRRLLAAAETVSAQDGLDAPVPAIAAEAGAGVGSVYRAFASKDDIVAALAVERLGWFTERARAAAAEADPGAALADLLRGIVARGAGDHVLAAALEAAMSGRTSPRRGQPRSRPASGCSSGSLRRARTATTSRPATSAWCWRACGPPTRPSAEPAPGSWS